MKKLFVFLVLALASQFVFAQATNARMLSGVNYQTGTTYTFVPLDATRVTSFTNVASIAATLPSGLTAGFGKGFVFSVINPGPGTVTITCTSCTINGSATLALSTGQAADIYGDGVNYAAVTLSGCQAGGPVCATIGGNNNFSGSNTSGSINSILWIDGTKYTKLSSAIAACPATGCEIWTPSNYAETLTSDLVLGNAKVGNTQPITLHLSRGSTLTVNVTDGSCAVVIPMGSSIISDGVIGNATGLFQGGAIISLASTASVSAAVCNGDNSGNQEYFNMAGVMVMDNASATVSSALVDLQALFVNSSMRDVIVLPANNHKGLRIRNGSVITAGFGPFTCDNCWLNGQALAGSIPLSIEAVSGGGLMTGINFIGGAIEHAGSIASPPNYQVIVDGTNGAAGSIMGVNFYGTYCENSFAANGCFKVRDAQNVTFTGVTVAGIAGTDVINFSESATARLFSVLINGLRDQVGFTNLINDTRSACSATIGGAANSSTLSYLELGPCGEAPTAGFYVKDKATIGQLIATPINAPTITGSGACATGSLSAQTGSWIGGITCGTTTGASSIVIAPAVAAPHFYHCEGDDTTSGHELKGAQSGQSPSQCTLKFSSVTNGDVIAFSITAY